MSARRPREQTPVRRGKAIAHDRATLTLVCAYTATMWGGVKVRRARGRMVHAFRRKVINRMKRMGW